MPAGDGTGPAGGGGGGRRQGRSAAGPTGYCVCTGCGYKSAHNQGQPCNQQQCPKCGGAMIRQ